MSGRLDSPHRASAKLRRLTDLCVFMYITRNTSLLLLYFNYSFYYSNNGRKGCLVFTNINIINQAKCNSWTLKWRLEFDCEKLLLLLPPPPNSPSLLLPTDGGAADDSGLWKRNQSVWHGGGLRCWKVSAAFANEQSRQMLWSCERD